MSVGTPEFEFLLACCRWVVCRGSGEALRQPAPEFDWQKFLRLVNRHRVQRLVDVAIRENAVSVPDALGEEIRRASLLVAERNVRSAQASFELLERFGDAAIRLLFLKGLTLSQLAYGDPYFKTGWDIDILVEPGAVESAAKLLSSLGYELKIPTAGSDRQSLAKWHESHKESLWHKPENGLNLDLHTSLSDTPSLISGVGIESPVQKVPIAGDRSLPTLTTPDLFAYLSVHGTWSAWYRLKWIADIAALLHRAGPDASESLFEHATRQKAKRPAIQALLLARRLFDLELPDRVRREIEKDPRDRLLLQVPLHELRQERSPTERPAGTVLLHLIRPLLLPGSRAKASEVNRQLRDVIQRATL